MSGLQAVQHQHHSRRPLGSLTGSLVRISHAALKELAKEFRMELSKVMRMRRVPELRFKYDDSVDRGERIEALLRGDK